MANIKKSQAEVEYNKQLRRLQRFIDRAEKRGYRFEDNIIPAKPKKITQGSVNRLKKITPDILYRKSTAISEVTGKVVSGEIRRKEEQTYKTPKKKHGDFETQRREQDARQLRKLRSDTQYAERFSEGELVYNRIEDLISDARRNNVEVADILEKVFTEEMEKYGRDTVLKQISLAPDYVYELVEQALWYHEGSEPFNISAILELKMLISGEIPSEEERKKYEETMERNSAYTNGYYE